MKNVEKLITIQEGMTKYMFTEEELKQLEKNREQLEEVQKEIKKYLILRYYGEERKIASQKQYKLLKEQACIYYDAEQRAWMKTLIAEHVERESVKMLCNNKTITKEEAFKKLVDRIDHINEEYCITRTDIEKWVAEELENINWDSKVAVIEELNKSCSK